MWPEQAIGYRNRSGPGAALWPPRPAGIRDLFHWILQISLGHREDAVTHVHWRYARGLRPAAGFLDAAPRRDFLRSSSPGVGSPCPGDPGKTCGASNVIIPDHGRATHSQLPFMARRRRLADERFRNSAARYSVSVSDISDVGCRRLVLFLQEHLRQGGSGASPQLNLQCTEWSNQLFCRTLQR